MPSTAASSGSSVSSSRRSPRSLPYDVEFSLTRTSSRTPWLGQPARPRRAPRAGAGTRTSRGRSGSRRTCSAGRSRRRASARRSGRRRAASAAAAARRRAPSPAGRSGRSGRRDGRAVGRARAAAACAGRAGRAARARRRRGCRWSRRRDVGVVVEAEHRVGLGQRLGELLAVPLGQAADGDDRLGAAAVLEVGRREQGVDRVLLGRLDEAAGVDDARRRRRPARRRAASRRRRGGRRAPRSRPRCGRSRG